ncbi:hypothetical protein [Streptomyces sp. NBC_01497]|uniref:hypothetical protein n=1 Tax=Streptomyces sp. NBC_01497 TaxID=2903885 RepID=UPI002E361B8E|nr:hypothetical protein [Streptomyces sp. NBC_01497]
MQNEESTAGSRLYQVMQGLLAEYGHQRVPAAGGPRHVVAEQDALDAIINLAAYLDGNARAGRLARNDTDHMAAMLMVVRDYVRPLPSGAAATPEAYTDAVTGDLRDMVDALRVAREREGRQG